MHKRVLGIFGVLVFGTFTGLSGAFAKPATVVPSGGIAAETCNPCVVTCGHMYDMMMRDCSNRRKYRTSMQVALCRGIAADEYGRCLADCKHNKK